MIMFEMLVGYPPFYADQPEITWQKILHWRDHFHIPQEANLSPEATDLILRLMSEADVRLGKNGADEIKQHPYFRGVDWQNMRAVKPPNIPVFTSEISNENFDKFDEEKLALEERKFSKRNLYGGKHKFDLDFIDFTYKGDVE